MSILTYLHVGTFRLAGFIYKQNKFNSKLLGDVYPLEQRSGAGSSMSELIICPKNFKICNDSKIMHKMIPVRNSDQNFPIFPNKVNPSNSVAIGGVFDITTPAIKSHVEQVKAEIEEKLQTEKKAVIAAQLAAVERERGIEQGRFSEKLLEALQDKIRPDDDGSGDGSDDGIDDEDDDSPPKAPTAPAALAVKKKQEEADALAEKKKQQEAAALAEKNKQEADALAEKKKEEADALALAEKNKQEAAAAAAAQQAIDDAKALAEKKKREEAATKYVFAFDVDKTLVDGALDTLYHDKYEIIENMRRVINSDNYVWIITANDAYNYKDFSNAYFGESNSDIYKSTFFEFMNPKIMEEMYTSEKKKYPAHKTNFDYPGSWTASDIHDGGLKPYAMYAQSLIYINGEFFKRNDFSIVKMYLFDDMSEEKIKKNSKKFDIELIPVTDFASSSTPNLLTKFKELLDKGPSKIGSAKPLVIPVEYAKKDANTNNDVVVKNLMASNAELPKCEPEEYANKDRDVDYDGLIGTNERINISYLYKTIYRGKIFDNLQVCMNGFGYNRLLTDTDIISWDENTDSIYSDHAPILYMYQINSKSNIECFLPKNDDGTPNDFPQGLNNISFFTWNIAYQMNLKTNKEGKKYYTSKFYCSDLNTSKDTKICIEDKKVYEKRLTNILTKVDEVMNVVELKDMNYFFLQECTSTLLDVVKNVSGFDDSYQIFSNQSEFCLVVRKSALSEGDIIIFDFGQNNDGSLAMSKYISQEFDSYDIDVNTSDLKHVMCYIVKSRSTIFFNVHFAFGKTLIFHRQIQLYNFMNAIVYSIRSIPKENNELYLYQNYDIVFTGDFNLNMLQRFPQDIKRFGYPGNNNMIPIFFTCNYIQGQKTIISTTDGNMSSARATNGKDHNYNLTNIDFSIFYPRIGDAGPRPTPVTILNGGIPEKLKLPVAPVVPASSSSSSSSSIPAKILKVMSFNTWYKPFNAQKKKEDDSFQEPGMQYCNVTNYGKTTNVCQENIMKEIMTQIEEGFQVIFLQEFTTRIQEVFDKNKCKFSDEYAGKKKQTPFTMTYTPSVGGSSFEYYVYSVTAQGETIVTLCSKSFFKNPATQYYMGNLTGYPNNPSYASDDHITQFWDISGGGRPYIVLVFDDIEMILINIHGPHGGTFNPYLQKVSKNPNGKGNFINIGKEDSNGPYEYEGTKYKYNSVFGTSIDSVVQTEIDKKIKDVEKLNTEYPYPTLQDYTFRQLGDMLRKRIPNQLKTYKIIFAGDFNMRPDDAKTHLVKLSERLSTGNYGEGPFSNSSGVFDKGLQNSLKLKVGDTDKDATGTCCVTNSSSSYSSGIYDQIYSNKLKVTKYWTYNGQINYDTAGGILFSDHLPVYAEIELPASAPSPPSSGGSKRFTLRNNNNNNKPISRKIRKHASTSTSASMPTTKFTKKQHSHNKKHKTRRHKH
jgi:flagellar biosynthesis GTPase FlhF